MEGDGGGRGEPQCMGQGYDLYNIENVHKVRILIHIPYIKVMPGYFLYFQAFVLFAQAPDDYN